MRVIAWKAASLVSIGVLAGAVAGPAQAGEARQVLSWGMNEFGQHGRGETGGSGSTPTAVPIEGDVESVAPGHGFHNIAVLRDGGVVTWGANFCGQLGRGSVGEASAVPTAVTGLPEIVSARTGACHSAALAKDGTVWAWGANASGQVGGVRPGPVPSAPVQVKGLPRMASVSPGGFHTAALDRRGRVWTWGNNAAGQLGRPLAGAADFTPGIVRGLGNDVKAVVSGGGFTVALKEDGTVWGFGTNPFGQLGTEAPAFARSPHQIAGLSDIVDIAAGRDHTIALRSDGALLTLGMNNHGQIGNGTTTDTNVPHHVALPGRVTQISAGGFFTLAVVEDGTVWAWGANGTGQLGDGTSQDRHTPAQVVGLDSPTQIAGGGEHSMALVAVDDSEGDSEGDGED